MNGPPDAPGQRSAIGAVLHHVSQRFRQGRRALPHDSWRAWQRTIAVGIPALLALMVLLRIAAAAALERGLLERERDFLLWLATGAPFGFSTAVFLQTFGSDITLVILVALTAGIAAWARKPITALSIVLAAVVPDLVGRFGWLIWSRARPDFIHDGIASPGFHSFPSGHTAKTIAVYGFLTLLWMRASSSVVERVAAALSFAVIASAVPFGRMAMGVHWPSDVIGGALIGGAWLVVLARGLRRERIH